MSCFMRTPDVLRLSAVCKTLRRHILECGFRNLRLDSDDDLNKKVLIDTKKMIAFFTSRDIWKSVRVVDLSSSELSDFNLGDVLECFAKAETIVMQGSKGMSSVSFKSAKSGWGKGLTKLNLFVPGSVPSAILSDALLIALCCECPSLKYLDISRSSNITDNGLIALVRGCKKLEYLAMEGCEKITDTGVLALSEWCTYLKTLDASFCTSVTDTSVIALAKACDLTELYLSETAITDASLFELAKCPLKILSLTSCNITDEGVVGLYVMSKHHSLEKLFLSGSSISDAAVISLASFTSLIEVTLEDCEKVTERGRALLKQLRPKIEIL